MATTPLQPIVFNKGLSTSWADLYTVPSSLDRIGIDAVVFNNYSDNTATYSVRIIQVGTPGDLNEIITDKDLRRTSNDLASSMIGQAIVKGGIIQAKASVNSAINVNITATLVGL